jgi:hypothetical protein
MAINEELMQETLDDDIFDEEWIVKINTGGEYPLSKNQARYLQQEISNGNRGIVMFQSFSISIPYIAEFFISKRFIKGEYQLPATTEEKPFIPMSPEKWEKFKKEALRKIGK